MSLFRELLKTMFFWMLLVRGSWIVFASDKFVHLGDQSAGLRRGTGRQGHS